MTDEHQKQKEKKKPSKLRRFLYGLSWTAIWPVVIVIPATIGMLVILSVIVTSLAPETATQNSVALEDGIFYFELYLVGFVSLLVVILMLVKWLLRTRKHLFFRSGATVLGAYIWVGVLATGLVMAFVTKNPETIRPPVSQDSQIMAVLNVVGRNTDRYMDQVSVRYVDSFEGDFASDHTAGTYVPVLDSDGKFSYGTINLKTGLDAQTERGVVAHEYLHHIWQTQLDANTIHDLTSQLMTTYGNDEWMKSRTDFYSDTNYLLPTELFAFYCTEVSDQYLTQYILNQCSTYIDRSTLTFTRV